MFVNYVEFPPIKPGKDAEFREWFARSNEEFAKHKGFVRRLLLKPRDGGNYAAIVEHESYETFVAMHRSPTQAREHEQAVQLFDGNPSPRFYDVVDL